MGFYILHLFSTANAVLVRQSFLSISFNELGHLDDFPDDVRDMVVVFAINFLLKVLMNWDIWMFFPDDVRHMVMVFAKNSL